MVVATLEGGVKRHEQRACHRYCKRSSLVLEEETPGDYGLTVEGVMQATRRVVKDAKRVMQQTGGEIEKVKKMVQEVERTTLGVGREVQ
ncbi:hypothetical protein GOBAR_DD33158 [Gossypium barbadense]|nr:hypothetical protein GOBAR_DD33158 [Gossypium barbadense]